MSHTACQTAMLQHGATRRHTPAQTKGATLIETLLALSLAGALALALLERQHGRTTTHLLALALLEAARAGAADGADPATIKREFESTMQAASGIGSSIRRIWRQRYQSSGQAAWQIEILNPHTTSFADHAAPGDTVLAFYYQPRRHADNLRRGWPAGVGPKSGQDVFAANQLHLRLRYLHQPLSPAGRWLIRHLGRHWRPSADAASKAAMAVGLWPLKQEIVLPMTSPARPVTRDTIRHDGNTP